MIKISKDELEFINYSNIPNICFVSQIQKQVVMHHLDKTDRFWIEFEDGDILYENKNSIKRR